MPPAVSDESFSQVVPAPLPWHHATCVFVIWRIRIDSNVSRLRARRDVSRLVEGLVASFSWQVSCGHQLLSPDGFTADQAYIRCDSRLVLDMESLSSWPLRASLLCKHAGYATHTIWCQVHPLEPRLCQPLPGLCALNNPLCSHKVDRFASLAGNLFLDLGARETATTALTLATWLANNDMSDRFAPECDAETTP